MLINLFNGPSYLTGLYCMFYIIQTKDTKMYLINAMEPNCWLLKIYTPTGIGTYSYIATRYIDALKIVRGIGMPLKRCDLLKEGL